MAKADMRAFGISAKRLFFVSRAPVHPAQRTFSAFRGAGQPVQRKSIRFSEIPFVFLFLLLFLLPVASHATEPKVVPPEENLLCWTEKACHEPDKDGKEGRWDIETPRAVKDCGGSTYGFCYAPKTSLNLAVAIPLGETTNYITSVTDFGEYIGAFYKYLVGISAIIAVVMVMVSGAQYVAASGSGDVGKAKERIKNAITGFILLLFAVLLLATINPQLLKLEVPPMPRVRMVYLDDGIPCETYKQKGFTLDPVAPNINPACGSESIVTNDQGGNKVEDLTCIWNGCNFASETHPAGVDFPKVCVNLEQKWQCIACQSTSDIPTSTMCDALKPASYMIGQQQQAACRFFDALWPIGDYCQAIAYDCSQIKSCQDYNKIQIQNWTGTGLITSSPHELKTICESNPCAVTNTCALQAGTGTECVNQ